MVTEPPCRFQSDSSKPLTATGEPFLPNSACKIRGSESLAVSSLISVAGNMSPKPAP